MPVRRVRDGVRAKLGLCSVGTAAAVDMALLLGTSALADTALAMLWETTHRGELVLLDELLAQSRASLQHSELRQVHRRG